MVDGGMRGLLARSVVVLDTDGTVLHTELVDAIGHEPDYDAAVAALGFDTAFTASPRCPGPYDAWCCSSRACS